MLATVLQSLMLAEFWTGDIGVHHNSAKNQVCIDSFAALRVCFLPAVVTKEIRRRTAKGSYLS
jgi:hypothetical protein